MQRVRSRPQCCAALSALAVALSVLGAEQFEVKPLEIADEVVCRVNTEAISQRQVEERIEEIVAKLTAWKRSCEANGQWTAEAKKRYDEMYLPAFRDALRATVRERLMLQQAREDKYVKSDERTYQKRLKEAQDKLRSQGLLGAKGFTAVEVEKRVRESVLLEAFWNSQFSTVLDQPTRPEVQKYYQENITRFYRPAGVKVRIIRIDGIVADKLTGKKTTQDALEIARKLREDVVSYSGNFAELAKARSNDEETKARGGLIGDPADPYFNPEGFNTQLAGILRDMKVGEVSPVIEFGKGYAFVLLEGRREAGSAPLEGRVYDEIYRTLMQRKARKQVQEWFRKALAKSLVAHVVEGKWKTLPTDFFFEEEESEKPGGEEPKPEPPAKKG